MGKQIASDISPGNADIEAIKSQTQTSELDMYFRVSRHVVDIRIAYLWRKQ